MDFVQAVLNDQTFSIDVKDPDWLIVFIDKESRTGKVARIGDGAYVMSGKTTFYFSSAHVVRMSIA